MYSDLKGEVANGEFTNGEYATGEDANGAVSETNEKISKNISDTSR